MTGRAFVFFGSSNRTSDFMVDRLLLWWEERQSAFALVKQLVINLDNGPECNGRRSQSLKSTRSRNRPAMAPCGSSL